MSASGDELSIQLERHYFKRQEDEEDTSDRLVGWGSFVLPIAVGDDYVLSTGLSLILNGSFISEYALRELERLGLVDPPSVHRGDRVWLRRLRLATHDLPDIQVRVGGVAEQLDVDAVLGRNFLGHFATLRYDIRSQILTFVRT